jgi:hypothetical protein
MMPDVLPLSPGLTREVRLRDESPGDVLPLSPGLYQEGEAEG